jgi:hypothetical protein
MAFAVSPDRTVLWDQFEYSGAPEDFSWILPVRPGAYIEAASDAWFEALEAITQVRVTSPDVACAQPSGGCCTFGFASADSAASGRGTLDPGGVEVIHHGTVGPYVTDTVRSTNGDELTLWLRDHGYFIPPDIEPIIAAYVAEGADFIALQLQPNVGVQAMTPVRVVTSGGNAILPLRMVAAGTGERVGIVLYVIGEQLLGMPDLHEERVPTSEITWDFTLSTSNYPELREQVLARNIGFTYLTTFADRGFFAKRYVAPDGSRVGGVVATRFVDNFADLYFAQARANDGRINSIPCPSIESDLDSDLLVRESAGSGELAATRFACDEYTDIAAAMIGMHPRRVFTGRLELDLPREALAMDCVLEPAATQTPVSQLIQATKRKNLPAFCDEAVFESRIAPSPPTRGAALLAMAAALGLLCLRRRGERVRPS